MVITPLWPNYPSCAATRHCIIFGAESPCGDYGGRCLYIKMADDRPVANHNDANNVAEDPPEPNFVGNGRDNNIERNDTDTPDDVESGSLRDFITRNYYHQQVGAVEEMSQADQQRRNNFFQRAVSESQRMSAEVERCQQRHEALQAELGAGNLHAWTMEHASEVTVTLPGPSQSTDPIPELPEPMDCNK